jgi:uncharacterized phage protein (TIGR01671 family)
MWQSESKRFYLGTVLFPGMWVSDNEVNDIEQCTGLKDKNGTLIYEGDIMQPQCYINSNLGRAVVGWHEGRFCFLKSLPLIDKSTTLRRSINRGKAAINPWIIIGNIHENGDLLC